MLKRFNTTPITEIDDVSAKTTENRPARSRIISMIGSIYTELFTLSTSSTSNEVLVTPPETNPIDLTYPAFDMLIIDGMLHAMDHVKLRNSANTGAQPVLDSRFAHIQTEIDEAHAVIDMMSTVAVEGHNITVVDFARNATQRGLNRRDAIQAVLNSDFPDLSS